MTQRRQIHRIVFVGALAFTIVAFVGSIRSYAGEAMTARLAALERAVEQRGSRRVGFRLLGYSRSGPSGDRVPRFTPIRGLDDANAVPFLIGVLESGPPWTDESLLEARGGIYPHIARCLAALSLGYIGDDRAYDPLLRALQNEGPLEEGVEISDSSKGGYPISDYAGLALVQLGGPPVVEVLISAMKDSDHSWLWTARGLAQLNDVRAIKPIAEHLITGNTVPGEVRMLHDCLSRLTRTDFETRLLADGGGLEWRQFPELGTQHGESLYRAFWQHWLKEGDSYAKKTFEQYYPVWVRARRESPGNRSRQAEILSLMTQGGVATMPFIMAEIEKGDDSLILAVEYLKTGAPPPSHALERTPGPNARAEVQQWWAQNRAKWTLFDSNEAESNVPDESRRSDAP